MSKAGDFGSHLCHIGLFANLLVKSILEFCIILTSTTSQNLENTNTV